MMIQSPVEYILKETSGLVYPWVECFLVGFSLGMKKRSFWIRTCFVENPSEKSLFKFSCPKIQAAKLVKTCQVWKSVRGFRHWQKILFPEAPWKIKPPASPKSKETRKYGKNHPILGATAAQGVGYNLQVGLTCFPVFWWVQKPIVYKWGLYKGPL